MKTAANDDVFIETQVSTHIPTADLVFIARHEKTLTMMGEPRCVLSLLRFVLTSLILRVLFRLTLHKNKNRKSSWACAQAGVSGYHALDPFHPRRVRKYT